MLGHLGYQALLAHITDLRASADKARRASRPGRRRILVTAAVAGCLLGVTACADDTESVPPSSGNQPNVEIPEQTTLPPPDPPPNQLTAPGPCTGGAAGAIGDCGP
jgi:hypothetical protein